MKYEVELVARYDDRTVTIEAASPQLAAAKAQREYPVLFEVTKVEGMECLGRCFMCERHVFLGYEDSLSIPEGDILCGLCKGEIDDETR